MQQALTYAKMGVPRLQLKWRRFLEHDRSGQQRRPSMSFPGCVPSPAELWKRTAPGRHQRCQPAHGTQDYYTDGGGKHPRYYRPAPSTPRLRPSPGSRPRLLAWPPDRKTTPRFRSLAPVEGGSEALLFLATATSCVPAKNNDFSRSFGHAPVENARPKAYEITWRFTRPSRQRRVKDISSSSPLMFRPDRRR